jgi:hypothetical protein
MRFGLKAKKQVALGINRYVPTNRCGVFARRSRFPAQDYRILQSDSMVSSRSLVWVCVV